MVSASRGVFAFFGEARARLAGRLAGITVLGLLRAGMAFGNARAHGFLRVLVVPIMLLGAGVERIVARCRLVRQVFVGLRLGLVLPRRSVFLLASSGELFAQIRGWPGGYG